MRTGRLAMASVMLLLGKAAFAGPVVFDLGPGEPPVIADSKAPVGCTVTWLIADTANNDLFTARMRIDASEGDTPVNNRLPCPALVSPRMAQRALDACGDREADPRACVFADMGRGFEREPDARNTAENASRCASDRFSDLGVACWMAGSLSVCNVGCGNSPPQAVARAQARCQEKQQRACPITGSVPVSGP